jgi:hypothetical protein
VSGKRTAEELVNYYVTAKCDVEQEMIRFFTILLATDGSPNGEGALKYARDLALRDNAQVIVVH